MEMKKFIEMGEKKAGNQVKLAKLLNIQASTLGLIKMGKKSLTVALCLKLAQFIEVDEVKVISASNLIIEKDPERRKIFESYLKSGSKAASFAFIAVFLSVNLIMTPTPANASQQPIDIAEEFILCKIDEILSRINKLKISVFDMLLVFFQRVDFVNC